MKKIIVCLILVTLLSLTFASAIDWSGLFAYFNFDEGAGTLITDIVNQSANGTGVGTDAADWVTGKLGSNALRFNAEASEYVSFINTSEIVDAFGGTPGRDMSVSFWINKSANRNTEGFLVKGFEPNNWGISINLAGDIAFFMKNTNDADRMAKRFNKVLNSTYQFEWTFITITSGGTAVADQKLYRNGVEITDTAALTDTKGASSVQNEDSQLNLSQTFEASTFFLNATIDELGFFNEELTVARILEFYNDGVGVQFSLGGDVSLISPIDAAIIPSDGTNFTANYSLTTSNFNFTNATYFIWNQTALINTTTVTIAGILNTTTQFIDDFELGNHIWNVKACWANTTFSNCTFSSTNNTFSVLSFKITSEAFSNSTIEGNIEFFQINITSTTGPEVSAVNLIYNGTVFPAVIQGLGGNDFRIFRQLTIPSVDATVNQTFFWNFILDNGFVFNSTQRNQTVSNLGVDNCSVNTHRILNFTIVDEEQQTAISGNHSLEILVNLFSSDESILISNYSESFNISSINICISENLSNFPSVEFSLDSTVKYSAQDHEIEYYNIDGFSLTNISSSQDITLFDLLTSDSTQFQLTFTGSDFLAVEDALVFVKRQYVGENVFKTVELPKTDSNGQTILHLVRNDIVYNIEIVNSSGAVLGNFENIIAFCEDFTIGNCKITLSAADSGEAVFNYNAALGITFTGPTYNNATRVISFNFLTVDGSVKTVLMNATRNDIFGNTSICSTSVTSSGGTLFCTVPEGIDDSLIIVKVFVDGTEVVKSYIDLDEFDYGKPGYFIFFVYMLAFIFMFNKSKTTMLIGILLGFISGITLGLISGRVVGIGASGIWLVIVIILMIWKLNKERPN